MAELVTIAIVILALAGLVAVLAHRSSASSAPPSSSSPPTDAVRDRAPARSSDPALRPAADLPLEGTWSPPCSTAPRRPGPTPGPVGVGSGAYASATFDPADRTRAPDEPLPAALDADAPPRPVHPHRPPARLFAMGDLVTGSAGGYRHRGPYAVVALATTGFTPMRDRIIEIAVVSTDERGRIVEEFTTLLDAQGGGVGPTFWHGIEPADLAFTPSFGDVASEVIARFEGRVVVAHNAELVEQFLAAGFLAAGLLAPSLPALNLLRLGQRTFATRNQRLATVADHLQLPERPGDSALGDARLTVGLLTRVLAGHGDRLAYPLPPAPVLNRPPRQVATTPRARRHESGSPDTWLAALLGRVSMSATEANDPRVAAYLEALTSILTRGRIVSQESRDLTRLLAASGYPAAQIRDILERVLESLRRAAFEERALTKTQLSHLRAAATSVGIPTYFDDLIPPPAPAAPDPGSGSFARPVRKPVPPPPPPRVPRCGHCLSTGHYTTSCPRLASHRSRRSGDGPVRPVDRIDPI